MTHFKSMLTFALLVFVFSVFHAQTIKVSGSVSDESGMPLPGVSVVIEGTSKGVATDFDGLYSIDVSTNSVLTFSYLGLLKSIFGFLCGLVFLFQKFFTEKLTHWDIREFMSTPPILP